MSVPTYIEWPRDLLPPRHVNPGFSAQSGGGQQLSLTGRLNNGGIPGRGIWKPTFIEIPVHEAVNLDEWMALDGQIMGRDLPIAVPYYHKGRYPKFGEIETCTFSDGATFDDGTEFISSGTHVIVTDFAAAGATTINITKIECGTIQTRDVFTICLHQYKVRSIVSQSTSSASITIAPELRADAFPRDEVDFVYPVVKSRLIDPEAMAIEFQYGDWSFPKIEFIEDTAPTI
ncbi:hypothetical protein [Roseibium sp. Sym1]|uniref:hypothetical protein n=1 Tax=Roseibium sp. Sym1 TaxID=3016006 RepID=UPI0022B51965|nr:hypothetical protein [Roseibium sp. Sym1]